MREVLPKQARHCTSAGGARRREPVADERQQHDLASDVVAFLRCWRRAAREHPRRGGARRRSRRIIHGALDAFLMARGARTEPSGTRLKEQLRIT